jgi:hypothetical protein
VQRFNIFNIHDFLTFPKLYIVECKIKHALLHYIQVNILMWSKSRS